MPAPLAQQRRAWRSRHQGSSATRRAARRDRARLAPHAPRRSNARPQRQPAPARASARLPLRPTRAVHRRPCRLTRLCPAQNAKLLHALAEAERHSALKSEELQMLQDGQSMLQQQLRVRPPAPCRASRLRCAACAARMRLRRALAPIWRRCAHAPPRLPVRLRQGAGAEPGARARAGGGAEAARGGAGGAALRGAARSN